MDIYPTSSVSYHNFLLLSVHINEEIIILNVTFEIFISKTFVVVPFISCSQFLFFAKADSQLSCIYSHFFTFSFSFSNDLLCSGFCEV